MVGFVLSMLHLKEGLGWGLGWGGGEVGQRGGG